MRVACIDTNMLIWGIQGVVRPNQEDMPTRAQALFTKLGKDHTRVIVPSVALGEFLLGIPTAEHARFQEMILRRFIVASYDGLAALHFAKIVHTRKEDKLIQQLRDEGRTKTEIRADVLIVAIALAAKAKVIYGHDDDVRKIAKGFITFTDLAEVNLQTSLSF